MASGSSDSEMLFFSTIGSTPDNKELVMNSPQDSNLVLHDSWFSAQQNHDLVAPQKPDPDAHVVIALSPTTLLDTNRYVCEVCYKGFPRKQNLTLHRRTHNLPFNLKTNKPKDVVQRKVYLCPEPTCIHHNASHALGDFGGLKKHYLRKHSTNRKYKCDTCSKAYTVETDLKSHLKICGKKKYVCHCGARFSRGYNIAIHQENCDAPEHNDEGKHSQTLQMGNCSVISTSYDHSGLISSITAHKPTSDIVDGSVKITENNNTLSSFNSYPSSASHPSQLCSYDVDHGSLMIFSSMDNTPPAFFSESSTQQNQLQFQANSDIGFYADLLMDNIHIENVIPSNINFTGDGSDIYGRSLSLTPSMHDTNLNGMLNPVSGSEVDQSSTINQYVDASYQKSDYGYGDASGLFGYGGGMEFFDFETSATISGARGGAEVPMVQHVNQHGFWF